MAEENTNVETTSLFGKDTLVMKPFEVSEGRLENRIVFPGELLKENNEWPHMAFYVFKKKQSIHLPIPQGLTFSDSVSYSSIDLGIIGTIGKETIESAAKQNTVSGALGAGIGALAGGVVNKAKKLNAAAAASILSRQVFRQDGIANVIDFSARQVIAPNTNTSFQNSNIRGFSFAFKLIAKNSREAKSIREMVQMFREYTYPEGNDVIMSYPPIWNIKFYDGGTNESEYIPKIYGCYLTSLSTTYNSTTNMFHEDGSPIEVDITVNFQETKALTRKQIKQLDPNQVYLDSEY